MFEWMYKCMLVCLYDYVIIIRLLQHCLYDNITNHTRTRTRTRIKQFPYHLTFFIHTHTTHNYISNPIIHAIIIFQLISYNTQQQSNLEADTTLGLLVTTEFEGLAAFQDKLMLVLADGTFQTQDNLLGSLGLLVENGFGLTTVAGLFTVITTFTLGEDGGLAGLVLGYLVGGVTTALLSSTKGFTSLRDVDLVDG